MSFSTKQHSYYCGIDLHARTLYVCLLDQAGELVFHRNMSTRPASFLKTIAPYREGIAVAVECIFPWYWLADLCAQEKVPFILGHALSMKAIHGGKAKTDKIDAHQIAVLLRGGMLPMAYVYPAELRSTRDLLRRRMPLRHKRSELLVHLQTTTSQYCLPEFGKKLADKNTREGVAEHFPDPRVRKSMEMDLSLIDHYDELLTDVARYSTKAAKIPDAEAFHRLRSVPGIGKSLALVILYEIHAFHRFPTVQDFASSARLVQCAKESAGKRLGYSGAKLGTVPLKWAFSEASVLFLRQTPQAQRSLDKLPSKHGKAKALSVLAQKLGRAVYFLLNRGKAFDLKKFFRS